MTKLLFIALSIEKTHIHRGDTMKLHPQMIGTEGRKEFVVLPFEEYQALTELMEDYEDLMDLRKAKEKAKKQGEVGLSMASVIADLGL